MDFNPLHSLLPHPPGTSIENSCSKGLEKNKWHTFCPLVRRLHILRMILLGGILLYLCFEEVILMWWVGECVDKICPFILRCLLSVIVPSGSDGREWVPRDWSLNLQGDLFSDSFCVQKCVTGKTGLCLSQVTLVWNCRDDLGQVIRLCWFPVSSFISLSKTRRRWLWSPLVSLTVQ